MELRLATYYVGISQLYQHNYEMQKEQILEEYEQRIDELLYWIKQH